MGFYTSLSFYRPTRPPRVTGIALAEFVRELSGTGLFERGGAEYLHVKFGRSIDKDTRNTVIYEPVPGCPLMSTVRSIKWDIEHGRISLEDTLTILSNQDRSIYRASVNLGALRRDVYAALQIPRPDDGRMNLCLWDAFIQIAPVELMTLGRDDTFAVGWMEVGFGGNGSLYPWTPRDLTSRADTLESFRPLTEICRRLFPVDGQSTLNVIEKLAPAAQKRRVRAMRQRMGDLWPYENLDREWDWFWGVCETG